MGILGCWGVCFASRMLNGSRNILSIRFRLISEYEIMKCDIAITLGLALNPEDNTDIEMLTKRADEGVYLVKDAGRNCYRAFKMH